MTDTLRGEILDQFCQHRQYLLLAMGLLGVFLILTLIGFTVIPPETPAYVVNMMNLFGLSVLFLLFGILTVYCHRYDKAR